MTHYIPAFTERNGRKEAAVCGRFIERTEHSPEPNCPTCAAWLLEDDKAFTETIAAQPELAAYFPLDVQEDEPEDIPDTCVPGWWPPIPR